MATAAYAAGVACNVYEGTEQPGPQRAQAGESAGGVAGSGGDGLAAAPDGGDDLGGSNGGTCVSAGGGGSAGISGEAGENGGGTAGNGAGGGAGTAGNGALAGNGGTAGNGAGGSAGIGGNGGTAGSAGGGGTSPCAMHPLTQRSTWTATASSTENGGSPHNAIDGNLNDRWSTGLQQTNADWLQVDFGAVVSIDQVTLQLGNNPSDFPRGYAIRFSDTSNDFAAPVLLTGAGKQATDTVISFAAPITGRYLLIAQTGSVKGLFWSVAEMPVACSH